MVCAAARVGVMVVVLEVEGHKVCMVLRDTVWLEAELLS